MGTLSFLRERSWRRNTLLLAIIAVLAAGATGITYAATGDHTAWAHALPAGPQRSSTAPSTTAPAPSTTAPAPSTTAPAQTQAVPAPTHAAPTKAATPTAATPRPATPRPATPRPARPTPTKTTATRTKTPVATTPLTIEFADRKVTLDVPVGWHVSHTAPAHGCGCDSDFAPVCVVAHGDYDRNPDNCELVVAGNLYDQLGDYPNPGDDLPRCARWSTVYDADVTAAGYPADYRQFRSSCSGRISEQWATVTTPQISFWHPLAGATDEAAVQLAVVHARISGTVRTGRADDVGHVRAVTAVDKTHVRIAVDRIVLSLDGSVINHNPATYSYRVITNDGASAGQCAADIVNCSAAQLLAQFAKGTHPADGTEALAGAIVRLLPYNDGTLQLEPFTPYRFTSNGDHGCGC
ncbi:MAG: hypothetical protein ABI301_08100 [Jatrophihabitantaceae bacterium]